MSPPQPGQPLRQRRKSPEADCGRRRHHLDSFVAASAGEAWRSPDVSGEAPLPPPMAPIVAPTGAAPPAPAPPPARKPRPSEAEQQLSELRRQNEELQVRLAERDASISKNTSQLDDYLEQIAVLREEKVELKSRAEAAEQAAQDLRERMKFAEALCNKQEEERHAQQALMAETKVRMQQEEESLAVQKAALKAREADADKRWEEAQRREQDVVGLEGNLAARETRLRAEQQNSYEERERETARMNERKAVLDSREAALEAEEERHRQRERQHLEACREYQKVQRQSHARRLSPRTSTGGKENQELKRQLEEQQDRMHEIKMGGWRQEMPSEAE